MIHLHMSEGAIGLLIIFAVLMLLGIIDAVSGWIGKLWRKQK